MRKMTYLAVFEPVGNGAYSVYFPNVLGCVSYGKNFQEAQAMAQEALELHIYGMEKDGDTLPIETFSDIQTNAGDIVYAITIYPDFVKNQMDNRTDIAYSKKLEKLFTTKNVKAKWDGC